METDVVEEARRFIAATHSHTSYESAEMSTSAEKIFDSLVEGVRARKAEDERRSADGGVARKFGALSAAVADRCQFMAMVKVAWRVVKERVADPRHRVTLMSLAVCAMVVEVRRRNPRADAWRDEVTTWLGKQLTVGGKGVAGEGEGGVVERINRFFHTPYLHDFD